MDIKERQVRERGKENTGSKSGQPTRGSARLASQFAENPPLFSL